MILLQKTSRSMLVCLSLALVFTLGGCAQSSKPRPVVAEFACPGGTTKMCEANSIGRIRHGTFARANDKCGCVPDDSRMMNSPVIPSTH